MDHKHPLVSIIIYNYNYGRYLKECFDSAINQSYSNVEILFSDNASTDDSWNIALAYNNQYPEKIFLARNHQNFGATANLKNCISNIRGKYFLILCSDDKIHADYLLHAVQLLESNLDTAMVITHRSIINERSEVATEAPFYNQTCKIPPPLQSSVYMMAAVNPSLSQVIYRTDYAMATKTKEGASGHGNRYLGARVLDFTISCLYAVIYIKNPLVYHRVHAMNDGNEATENLMQVIGPYFLNIEFKEIAQGFGFIEVSERFDSSVEKLAKLALRYAISALIQNKERLSKRYFYLAIALFPEVEQDQLFKKIALYWQDESNKDAVIQSLISSNIETERTISYDPPDGSMMLQLS